MAKKGPQPVDAALGRRIKRRREELGLTLKELGIKLGVTFQQVQKYELGETRMASMVLRLAAALEMKPSELLKDLETKKGRKT